MKFRVVHATQVPPSQRGIWFIHEHSATFATIALTLETWLSAPKKAARDVLKWQTGPRWGVVCDDEAEVETNYDVDGVRSANCAREEEATDPREADESLARHEVGAGRQAGTDGRWHWRDCDYVTERHGVCDLNCPETREAREEGIRESNALMAEAAGYDP